MALEKGPLEQSELQLSRVDLTLRTIHLRSAEVSASRPSEAGCTLHQWYARSIAGYIFREEKLNLATRFFMANVKIALAIVGSRVAAALV